MTDTKLLKAKMILNGDTIQTLADSLGINRQNASIKINGRRDFKQSEIAVIAKRYKLSYVELEMIFFSSVKAVG